MTHDTIADLAIRDTPASSRKGRKPKFGIAMTPAQRKQHQRQRQRESRNDQPRWLRLRHALWLVVQREFPFSDANELASALSALGMAVVASNVHYARDKAASEWLYLWRAYGGGEVCGAEKQIIDTVLVDLKPYDDSKPDGAMLLDIMTAIVGQ